MQTMESVEAQTMQPDRRIVICDNCTDATPLARARARLGGVGDRRQHRQEGRRAQPGVGSPGRRPRPTTTTSSPWTRTRCSTSTSSRTRTRSTSRSRSQGTQARRRLRELPGARARQRARRAAEDGVRPRREDQPLPARARSGARRRGDDVLGPGAARGLRLARQALRARPDRGLRALAGAAGPRLRDDGAAQLLRAHRPDADGADAVGPAAALVPRRVRVPARLRLPQEHPQRHRLARFSLWAAASRWLFLVALGVVLFRPGT